MVTMLEQFRERVEDVMRLRVATLLVLTAAWSCADSPLEPDVGPADDCTTVGTEHSAAIEGDETWRRSDGPHHVTASITVGETPGANLTIEAGTLVCFAPDGAIVAVGDIAQTRGSFLAEGTEEDPIVFTAIDPLQPWGGITIGSTAPRGRISHARIEHARIGIVGQGIVDIDHTVIRQITGPGIGYWYYNEDSRITNTVVDSAGLDGSHAVYLEGGTLEGTIIKNSGGTGLRIAARYARVAVQGCEISGSGGDGVDVTFRTVNVVPIHGCNLVGNAGVGVNSRSEASVDANGNWWGDPEGPLGPAGDGVSGDVDYGDYRTEPVVLGGSIP